MSKRYLELFLFDIFVAIVKIEKSADSFEDADDLKHNYMAWDSVIREFQIIGEATRHLIANAILDEKRRQIVDFRNLIVHHYFGIDEDAVWATVQNNLSEFKEVIVSKIETIETP